MDNDALLLVVVTIIKCLYNKIHIANKVNNRLKQVLFTGSLIITLLLNMIINSVNVSAYAAKVDNTIKTVKEIQDVPVIGQMPELPSGCEITAAAMLLQWAGVKIDKQELAKAIPKGLLPSYRNGKLYGSSPNKAFIGDPFSNSGFGVYHKPVTSLIANYLPDPPEDITGMPFESILEVVGKGRPVIVWATMNMLEPQLYATWYDESNSPVNWIIPEHSFIIIGYSNNEVIVNDPFIGKRQQYPVSVFKERWESMGRQAVTVSYKVSGNVVVTNFNNSSKKGNQTQELGNSPKITEEKQDSNMMEKAEKIFSSISEAFKEIVDEVKEFVNYILEL